MTPLETPFEEKTVSYERRRSVKRAAQEDSLQFLWAVSYTDLLMVLLCFFVLFFGTPDVKPSVINDVIVALGGKATGDSTSAPPQGNQASGLLAALNSIGLTSERDPETGGILVHLPDNLYPAGEFALNDRAKESLAKLLARIEPYAGQLTLTLIGHADAQPLLVHREAIVDSNLVLSSLRASRAAEFVMESGFDPRAVLTQGAGEYERSTRSLSIRISDRKKI